MDENLTDKLLGRGQDYLKRVSILPPSYRRISHGDEISIGTRRFKVITGGGHALDQVMLYCAADKLFLSADEVLDELIDAGLESLTGGGAEIFDWDVRKQVVDHNTHWEDWSRIHRLAHHKGLKTQATML